MFIRLFALLLSLLLLATACGDTASTSSDDSTESDTTDAVGGSTDAAEESADADNAATGAAEEGGALTIGFSQPTQQSPFYVELTEGAQAAAEAGGHELLFVDANGDVNKQNNDIQDLITRGIDVLVLNPVNPEAVIPSIQAAEEAGIPVITVDRPVESGAVAHVGRDNVEMGKLVGDAVADYLGEEGGKIIEIQGDAGGIVMMNRRDGFEGVMEGADSIDIVQGPYAEYIRSNAVTAMQDLLEANDDLSAVYAHNDDMALGALQVLQEAGRDDVVAAGVDGLMEAVEAMAEGDQYIATAANDPRYLGDVTIQAAEEVTAGNQVPEFVDAGTRLILPEDAEEFIGDTLFIEYRPEIDFSS